MASLQEIHQQSYADMPIGEFAQKYHAKFYADMPFDEFAKRSGLTNIAKEPSRKTEAGFSTRAARESGDMLPIVSQGNALGTAIQQGATANFADEIKAGNAAALQASGLQDVLDKNPGMKVRQGPVGMLIGGLTGGAVAAAQYMFPDKFGTKALDAATGKYAREQDAIKAGASQYPVTSLAGNIAGGVALPVGAVNNARQGAALAAGYGAVAGAGGGDSLGERAAGAGVGAAIGAPLGYGLGKLAERGVAKAAQPVANEVTLAAERQRITVPTAIASDSPTVQRLGQGVRNIPMAGERIVQAVTKTGDETTAALDSLATGLGTGDVATAGQAASTSIRNWITGDSKKAVTAAYDAVDNLIDPNVTTTLSSTQAKIADIMARRAAERVEGQGQAVSFVLNAAQDAEGLTYQGLKGLRTRVGEMLDNPSMLPAGTSQAELRQIYGALTDDLANAVASSGGPQARSAWEKANRFNQMVSQRREELAKIVGTDADAAAEKVFSRLQAMASTSSSANIQMLAKARSAIGNDWNEFGSAVIGNLGRDATGTWTPDRFVTGWGKLSDAGKSVLFDKTTRAALDDIATISERMQQVGRRFGNPSGTAQNAGLMAMTGTAAAEMATYGLPVKTISALLGGNIASRILASPATASSAAKWSRAYEMVVTKPSAGTLSAFNIASRNFANTVSDKLGVNVKAEQLFKALSGPNASRSDADQEKQN